MALLPLPGDLGAELAGIGFVRRDSRDPFLPESDVHAGPFLQEGGEFGVPLAAGYPQLEQGIVRGRARLWRQHPGSGAPALALLLTPLEEQYLTAGLGQVTGTGRPDGAGTDHDDVVDLCHAGDGRNFLKRGPYGQPGQSIPLEENSMFRSLFGFAVLAVVAWIALHFFFRLFGIIVGLMGTLLWLAFLGFLVYLVLRVFAPGTADRVKEMISGRPSSTV
jgi:hypothetical protein